MSQELRTRNVMNFSISLLTANGDLTGVVFRNPHRSWRKKLIELDEVSFVKEYNGLLYIIAARDNIMDATSFVRAVFRALGNEELVPQLLQRWELDE